MIAKIQIRHEVCQLLNQNTGTEFDSNTVYDAVDSIFTPDGLCLLVADKLGNVRTLKEIEFIIVNLRELKTQLPPNPGLVLPNNITPLIFK